ncbi:MAG: thioredoxin domain-containing protein [Taibaiella sp.]|nr:thioredoxin domain-containing protein [Taibaiella sp.]
MRSNEFKTLLGIQVITLIIVVILLFNSLAKPSMGRSSAQGFAITSEKTIKATQVNAKNNFVFGVDSAANFLMVFSRYNCSYCRHFYANVFDSLQQGFIGKGKLKVICKDLVGPEDEIGMLMAKVAEVARQTNHFPEVHRLLTTGNEPQDSVALIKLALKAGVTELDLKQRLNSTETSERIRNDYYEAKGLNITGTPSFVINGKVHLGYMTYADIISVIGTKGPNNKSCDVN